MTSPTMMASQTAPLLKFFSPDFEVDNPIATIVKGEFYALANTLEVNLHGSAEKTIALRKLMEARDACIRACL